MATPKYIVKLRACGGSYTVRSCMGTKSGLRWHRWITWRKYGTLEEARQHKKKTGLYETAIFYRGKRIETL